MGRRPIPGGRMLAAGRGRGEHGRRTPFNRSKMTRMATQNSSKSRLPSPSTSARSQTRASWSSLKPLFLSTGAACSPVRNLPPLVRVVKIFQYVSISCASIRGGAMAAVWGGGGTSGVGGCRSGPTGGFAIGEFEQSGPIDVEGQVRGYGSWDCWNCRVAVSALSAKAVVQSVVVGGDDGVLRLTCND